MIWNDILLDRLPVLKQLMVRSTYARSVEVYIGQDTKYGKWYLNTFIPYCISPIRLAFSSVLIPMPALPTYVACEYIRTTWSSYDHPIQASQDGRQVSIVTNEKKMIRHPSSTEYDTPNVSVQVHTVEAQGCIKTLFKARIFKRNFERLIKYLKDFGILCIVLFMYFRENISKVCPSVFCITYKYCTYVRILYCTCTITYRNPRIFSVCFKKRQDVHTFVTSSVIYVKYITLSG